MFNTTIHNILQLKMACKKIATFEIVSCDIETTGLDWRVESIVGIAFYGGNSNNSKSYSFHIPMYQESYKIPDREGVISVLKDLFANEDIDMAFHNGNFDRSFIERLGIPVKNFVMDTMYAYHLINSEEPLALKKIIPNEYNVETASFKSVFTKKNPVWSADAVTYEKYFFDDVLYTFWLARDCKKALVDRKLDKYFYKIEMPMVNVMFNMHKKGYLLDIPRLEKFGKELEADISNALDTIFTIVGDPDFNPRSSKQLGEFVFNVLNAPVIKKSRTSGKPSCDASVLEIYANNRKNVKLKEFSTALLAYRKKHKLHSVYVVGMINLAIDNRIHPSFKALTGTGRLSCSTPNIQNIPRASMIRNCFIVPKGKALVVLDYSQIELRILAHMTKDKALIQAYKDGLDIHQMTADKCGSSRQNAKAINFGLIYLMSARTLAKTLSISVPEAEDYVSGYFRGYSGIAPWHRKIKAKAHKHRATKTLLGRPRQLPKINNSAKWIAEASEREGINNVIQGTAGELCKLAMIDVDKAKIMRFYGADLISQVHDELHVVCDINKVKATTKFLRKTMEDAFLVRGIKLDVPIIAEGDSGTNWGDCK